MSMTHQGANQHFGSSIWFEKDGQEWVILRSDLAADLYRVDRFINRLDLHKYATTNVLDEDSNDDVKRRLFTHIMNHPRKIS